MCRGFRLWGRMINPRAHMYVNDLDETQPLPNATVWEDTKTSRVTYRGEDGSKFRVVVRQKPNPIGFTAKLPGDRRR